MPELPEVETLARDLRAAVLGRSVTDAWVAQVGPLAGDRHDPPV